MLTTTQSKYWQPFPLSDALAAEIVVRSSSLRIYSTCAPCYVLIVIRVCIRAYDSSVLLHTFNSLILVLHAGVDASICGHLLQSCVVPLLRRSEFPVCPDSQKRTRTKICNVLNVPLPGSRHCTYVRKHLTKYNEFATRILSRHE